jgi:hypothetical protein
VTSNSARSALPNEPFHPSRPCDAPSSQTNLLHHRTDININLPHFTTHKPSLQQPTPAHPISQSPQRYPASRPGTGHPSPTPGERVIGSTFHRGTKRGNNSPLGTYQAVNTQLQHHLIPSLGDRHHLPLGGYHRRRYNWTMNNYRARQSGIKYKSGFEGV